jgi:hypothetical protein
MTLLIMKPSCSAQRRRQAAASAAPRSMNSGARTRSAPRAAPRVRASSRTWATAHTSEATSGPHLRRDWAHPIPHLHRDWARPAQNRPALAVWPSPITRMILPLANEPVSGAARRRVRASARSVLPSDRAERRQRGQCARQRGVRGVLCQSGLCPAHAGDHSPRLAPRALASHPYCLSCLHLMCGLRRR